MSINKVKIFLASSSELKEDRREFEIAIQRKNDNLVKKGIYLDIVVWEDFLDQVSATRLQEEYNKVILKCDIFVLLFFTKVGKLAFEEFQIAYSSFIKTGKPKIFTYFKNVPIESSSLNEADTNSMFQFKNKLGELGHYVTHYKSLGDLKYHFSEQLVKLKIDKSTIQILDEISDNENIKPNLIASDNADSMSVKSTESESKEKLSTQHITKLISQGKTEAALDRLNEIASSRDESILNDVIMIKARFNNVKKQNIMGLIANDQFTQESNKIVFSLLELVKMIDK